MAKNTFVVEVTSKEKIWCSQKRTLLDSALFADGVGVLPNPTYFPPWLGGKFLQKSIYKNNQKTVD